MDRVAEAIQSLIDHSGITGINPVEMVIQIVATLLLIVVVKYFFWDKITSFIDQRRDIVDGELNDATEKSEEAKQLKEDASLVYEKAKEEAKSIVDDAKEKAESQKRDIIKSAKQEAERIKHNAKQDVDKEIELARSKMRNEIIDVATMLTHKAIEKKIDKKTYDRLIDQAIKEVSQQ